MKIIVKNSCLVFQAITQNYIEESVIKQSFITSLENANIYIEGWSYFLPISPGEIVYFTESVSGGGYIAFLKSIDNIRVGIVPDFCEETTLFVAAPYEHIKATAPQDAKYLYISGYSNKNHSNYTPIELTINNGYNIIPELKEKHGK